MSEHDLMVACPACGAKNRILAGKLTDNPACGSCKAPLVDLSHPFEVDDASFDALVHGAKVPVLVDFWASWCGPCRAFAPTLEGYALAAKGRVIVAKVNVDSARRTAAACRIQSIPTLAIYASGREAARHVGGLSPQQLDAFVASA